MLRAAATALLLVLLGGASAEAAPRDRDRDGMADRWERKHHVEKARADHDRDGLNNRAEYRLRTHPRRADSDRDGLRDRDEGRFRWNPRSRDTDRDGILDGKENAGVVTSVDGLSVVIQLASGGTLGATIEDPSILDCEVPAATLPGATEPPVEETFWDPAWGDQPADPDSDADLAPGAVASQLPGLDGDEEAEQAETPELEDLACEARLDSGALVHEATAEQGRLTRLSLVAT